MSEPTPYIRCPVCGKLSRELNFDHESLEHNLEIALQYFVGRGHGGFEWQRLPAGVEVLEMLEAALEAALGRVQLALQEQRGY